MSCIIWPIALKVFKNIIITILQTEGCCFDLCICIKSLQLKHIPYTKMLLEKQTYQLIFWSWKDEKACPPTCPWWRRRQCWAWWRSRGRWRRWSRGRWWWIRTAAPGPWCTARRTDTQKRVSNLKTEKIRIALRSYVLCTMYYVLWYVPYEHFLESWGRRWEIQPPCILLQSCC